MSKHKRKSRGLSADDMAYLDGLLSFAEDFSDGAWQAACESAIADDPRFKGRDAYDVWLAWATKGAA